MNGGDITLPACMAKLSYLLGKKVKNNYLLILNLHVDLNINKIIIF